MSGFTSSSDGRMHILIPEGAPGRIVISDRELSRDSIQRSLQDLDAKADAPGVIPDRDALGDRALGILQQLRRQLVEPWSALVAVLRRQSLQR